MIYYMRGMDKPYIMAVDIEYDKNKIIQLLDSIDDEKHMRYLYILIRQMVTKKSNC